MPRKIEVSHKSVVFAVLFLLGLWFLYFIRDIILQVFVALLIMAILNPLVSRLQKLRIPRALSIFVVYVVVLGGLGYSISRVVPALLDQTTSFARSLPGYLSEINLPVPIGEEVAKEISGNLANLPGQILKVGISIFSNILSLLMVLIIAFYLLLSRDKFPNQLESILDEKRAQKIWGFVDKLEVKLGSWVRGQLILMLLVGVSSYIGLLILGVPYALSLAILAGILEVVPILGPVFAAIPAVIVGFGTSPITGLAVVALAFLIQQVENYVFVPNVMKKSVGLSPVITLISLIIGFRVAGVTGAILCIPVVLTIETAVEEYLR